MNALSPLLCIKGILSGKATEIIAFTLKLLVRHVVMIHDDSWVILITTI